MAPTCLYGCLATSGHAPNETTDSVLGYIYGPGLHWASGQSEVTCNLVVSDGPKYNVPEVFSPGIVMHQEEPRTHCASVGSDNGSKDFIPIPNGRSGCHCLACRGLCIPPWICLPRPSLTHQQTGHTERCYMQHNVFHGFSRPFHVCHMCSGWTCSHLWKAQDASGGFANSGV